MDDANLAEEQRKKDRAEEELATKKSFQNIREQANDWMNEALNMWDKITNKSVGVAQVCYHLYS